MKTTIDPAGVFKPAWLNRAAALPIYAVLALTLSLIWFSDPVRVSHENRMLALLLYTLPITGVSVAGAWLAVRGYLAGGPQALLYSGCGLVAMGSGLFLSGLIRGGDLGANDAITLRSIGAFFSACLHLTAALQAARLKPSRPEPSAFKVACALLGVLVLSGLSWAAAQYDLVPDFYIAGAGSTPLRQLVLVLSMALLAIAAAFLAHDARRRDNLALRCYGLGLGLIALGLGDAAIAAPGSILNWAGRLSQTLGHVYLLAAFIITIRKAARKGFDVQEATADFYLDSEGHYRALVDTLRQAVITLDPKGRVVLWNPQAEVVFGYHLAEATGRPLVDLVAPAGEGREVVREVLSERRGRYLEVRLSRKNGEPFPAEILVLPAGSRWAEWTNLIVRDITERRDAEERLKKETDEIVLANRILKVFLEETGDDLFDKALHIVMEGMQSEYGVFGYIDEKGDLICPSMSKLLAQCEVAEKCVHYPRDRWKGLWSRALLERRAFYSNELALVPAGHVPIRRNLTVPILFQDRVIGLLNLANKATDYTDRDREIIEGLAGRIAPVLYAWLQKKMRDDERAAAAAELAYLASFPGLNPHPVAEVDLDGKVRFCNPAAERLFPDLRQRGQVHPWLSGWSAIIRPAVEDEKRKFEKEVAIGNQWYHQTLLFIPESRSFRIYGLDITGLKATEQRLRESQADLNWAQAVGRIGSWRLNLQRNELLWSDENHQIFGVPKGTPMSYQTFLGIVHPEDREYVDREWTAALGGAPYDIEHRIVAGDLVKWVRERAELEFDAGGQLLGGFGITQDITDRKQAEEALQQAKEYLEEKVRSRTRELEDTVVTLKNEIIVRTKIQTQLHQLSRVFMEAADPIIIEDLEGKVIEMNHEAEAVYGWSRDELIGKSIYTLFLPERLHLAAEVRERCRRGEEIRNYEGVRKAKSGRIFQVLLTAFPLTDQSGDIAFIVTICKDISTQKEMEAQLHDAHRHLRELSRKSLEALETDRRNVSRELHDSIGGSLAAIKFGLEEVAEQALRRTVSEPKSIETLVSHLADTIKETKRISANLRPLSLDDLGLVSTIEWYTRQFRQRYESIRVICQIDVEDDEIPEEAKIVIYRVMQESLANAARHSRADTICIRLSKSAFHFEFTVEDNGFGFEARETFIGPDRMSGFGLKSMQERAEISGGVLNVLSRPGEGTSVRLTLPLGPNLSGFV
jgi:PAS domain S-box-containing protein